MKRRHLNTPPGTHLLPCLRRSSRGAITPVPLDDVGVLGDKVAMRQLLHDAGKGAPFDLLVFNCGEFEPEHGVLDMRQADATVRRHMMDLNGFTAGAAAAELGTQQFLYLEPASGLGEDNVPPSWWCDYCTPGDCPAVWGCCSVRKVADPSPHTPTPPPPDAAVLGTVSVSGGEGWAPPDEGVLQGMPVPVQEGEGASVAHSLASILGTPSVAAAGAGLREGVPLTSAHFVAAASGIVPSAAGAVPTPASTVAEVEAGLAGEEEEE